jgi:hypothetical protein
MASDPVVFSPRENQEGAKFLSPVGHSLHLDRMRLNGTGHLPGYDVFP